MLDAIRRSISLKFMTAVMVTTFIAVLVSGLANFAYDVHDFRTAAVADLSTQADILGQVNLAAIEFDDATSATTALDQLRSRPNILAAAVYRTDGSVFASYVANGQTKATAFPARPGPVGSSGSNNDLELVKSIHRGAETVGTIYLHASYPIDETLARNLRTLAAVVFLSLVIAAVVSSWLQAAVTKPVRAMTEAVLMLIKNRDFSQRVTKKTVDETGVLVDAFNTMLAEIGSHAALLEQSNAALKHEVGERIKTDRALQELNLSLEQRIEARSEELNQAHEQLRHAQKMEAIGQLTGGVAHDFNNVLQVISGNLQLLALALPNDFAAQRRIETAKFATERGAKLSSQLLAFARKQPLQPAPTDLGRVLRAMDDMLRRALGESIEIETVVARDLWNTMVDQYQIENVILNLAINARDAMDGQGRLTLEVGNATLDEHYTFQEPDEIEGQYVVLAISDTGCGMPPDIIERAFEPFFTTKKEGEGTGLGLSMAFGFVKQSNGHIKIYSEVGCGTTIRIYLPRSDSAEQMQFNGNVGDVHGGAETILIVEDDLAVQATAVDMLTQLGYTVLKANDGASALGILQSGLHIDMLFTDVVMPGPLRSPDLARQAKILHPHIAVLFTSGYTQDAIVHGGKLDPGVELISKPYQRSSLARRLRHVFANSAQSVNLNIEIAQNAETDGGKNDAEAAISLRILVVEDEPDNRRLLEELLGLLGHVVFTAGSAEDALKVFAQNSFDVLLTDVNLPGISGVSLAETLHASAPLLRIVFSSGAAIPASSLTEGFVTLPKPYQIDQLQQALGTGTESSCMVHPEAIK